MPIIDERIVSLKFDNKGFEKNAKESISTLDKLKKSSDMDESAKSLENYQKQADNFDLRNLKDSFDGAGKKIGAFEAIALGALARIGSRAADIGLNLAKSLSVGQIAAGWAKYSEAIASEQTIMSAVEGKKDAKGDLYDMDAVLERVKKLKWYSDETSYSVNQMTTAIGSFTSAGIDLDIATTAILGISNACADAGVSTQKAESAYLAFSKAIGSGSMTLGIWNNQLKTSGLTNSERFKQSLIDTAIEMKTLSKNSKVTTANLTESLNKGWLTTEVMLKALSTYSDTTEILNKLVDGDGLDLQAESMKDFAEALKKSKKTLADVGLERNFSTASSAINALKDAYVQLGLEVPKSLNAFSRAQEAITFSQAIDATKEAVSSKWSDTYELLFGNYEESKELWTWLSNELYDVFAAGGDTRNEVLEQWHQTVKYVDGIDEVTGKMIKRKRDTGYTMFLETVKSLWSDVADRVSAFKDGLYELVPLLNPENTDMMYESLMNFTEGLLDFSKKIQPSEESLEKLTRIGKGAGAVLDIIALGLEKVWNATKPIRTFASGALHTIIDGIATFADILVELKDELYSGTPLSEILGKLSEKFGALKETFENSVLIRDVCNIVSLAFSSLSTAAASAKDALEPFVEFAKDGLGHAWEYLSNLFKSRGIDFFKIFGGALAAYKVWDWASLGEIIGSMLRGMKGIGGLISDTLYSITDSIWQFSTNLEADTIMDIAKAVALLGAGLLIMSHIDSENLSKGLFALGTMMAEMTVMMKSLNGLSSYSGSNHTGIIGILFGDDVSSAIGNISSALSMSIKMENIKSIATALIMIAGAMKVLSTIEPERLMSSIIAMGFAMAELAAMVTFVSKSKINSSIGAQFAGISAGLLVISGAMKVLSTIDNDGLTKSVIAIGWVLGFIAAYQKVLSNSKNLKKSGKAMETISFGLLIIAGAMKVLSTIPEGKIMMSLFAIMSTLTMMVVALNQMPTKGALTSAASLVVLSSSLLIITSAFALFSAFVNPDRIMDTVLAIGAVLTMLVASAHASKSALSGAAALAVMSTSLIFIATAIATLSVIPFASLIKSVLAIGAGVAIFVVAIKALGLVAPSIMYVSGALLIFGLALTTIGIGVSSVVVALGMLVGFVAVDASLIVDAIKLIIKAFVDSVIIIAKGIGTLIVEVLKTLRDAIPQIVLVVADTLIAFINVLTEKLPEIIEALFNFVVALLNGMRKTIQENGSIVISAFVGLLTDIIGAILDSIPDIKESFNNLLQKAKDTIGEWVGKFFEAGANLIQGLINGIKSKVSEVWSVMTDSSNEALIAAQDAFGIHSPSRKMYEMGEYLMQGLANGITESSGLTSEAMDGMANDAMNGFNSAVRSISAMMNDEFGNPTIRPVLDLSDVRSGIKGAGSMFQNGVSLYGSYTSGKVSTISDSLNSNGNPGSNSAPVYSFTQNNYSPKALSRIEIYRQTKNQFAALKGMS